MINLLKPLTLTFGLISLLVLPSCNTLAGIGRDMTCVGCQIADTANRGFFNNNQPARATGTTIQP